MEPDTQKLERLPTWNTHNAVIFAYIWIFTLHAKERNSAHMLRRSDDVNDDDDEKLVPK